MKQLPLIELPDIVTIQAANNHLKRCDDRPYTLRFTVDNGPKFVGKRISISLDTKDIAFAERVSAVCIESLKKSGFVLSGIKFSKPPEDFNNMALFDCIQALIVKLEGVDDETVDLLNDAIDAAK